MRSQPPLNSFDPKAVGAIALGVAAGLVVADRLGRTGRGIASVAFLGMGIAATAPFLAKYATRQWNAPTHRFGSRKTLERIRQHGVTELSEFSLDDNSRALHAY